MDALSLYSIFAKHFDGFCSFDTEKGTIELTGKMDAQKFIDELIGRNHSEPIQAPVTLDDVARLSQELCDEVRRRNKENDAYVSERIASLRDAVGASSAIDVETAGVILMNKINDMLKDVFK